MKGSDFLKTMQKVVMLTLVVIPINSCYYFTAHRYVRLGTASMLSTPDGPFINLGRLNLSKYAQKNTLARSLFEYIFHHENDVRHVCTYPYSAEKLCTIVLLTISLRSYLIVC